MTERDRARFETAALDDGYDVSRHKDGVYRHLETVDAWWGFSAALASDVRRPIRDVEDAMQAKRRSHRPGNPKTKTKGNPMKTTLTAEIKYEWSIFSDDELVSTGVEDTEGKAQQKMATAICEYLAEAGE